MNNKLPRRKFLQVSSAAAATTLLGQIPSLAQTATNIEQVLGAEDSKAAKLDENAPQIRVLLHEADGKPLEHERQILLHARDLENDPLPQAISAAEGRARIGLATEPLQISGRLKVPGFGEVYCYADNNGKGYAKPETIEFVVDAAATRLRRVREVFEREGKQLPSDPIFEKHLASAAQKIPAKPELARIAAAYESLSHGLHAGEILTLNAARNRIAKLSAPRKNFLFGALMSSLPGRGAAIEKRFTDAFNFAPTTWYSWKNEEPAAQRIDYGRMDQSLQWCLANKIVPKNYGYVYLSNGATPEWIRKWPFEKVLAQYKQVVAQTTRRYAGNVPYVEVINEAHDKANLFRFSHAQVLELTRVACQAAREGSPTVKRQINHCCLWAEYAKRTNTDGSRRWSPYRYLTDCVKAGVEFENVGLQLYYPQQDLFEIERMLERFKKFNRPIQITEISCQSAEGLDLVSMRPKNIVPGWHGTWSETMQADWLEAMFTLCYSKPEFEAVGWWDLADYGGHFWPHGGLLRKDFSPKESYLRLLKLQKDWGVAKV
ncbi:MAG: endo-1,4-beta-xylanase [Verrucomicrobiota bacterium]